MKDCEFKGQIEIVGNKASVPGDVQPWLLMHHVVRDYAA
jgi:hypothetical protein